MWADPCLRRPDIRRMLAISDSALDRYVVLLNLPPRAWPRSERQMEAAIAVTRANHRASAERQLARLERELAKEQGIPIKYRRCEVCQGMEATSDPHHHPAAA